MVIIVNVFNKKKKLDTLTTDEMFKGQRFAIFAMFSSSLSLSWQPIVTKKGIYNKKFKKSILQTPVLCSLMESQYV